MLMLTLSIKANTLYATLKGKLTEKEVRDFHFYFKPYMQSKEVKEVICNCKGLLSRSSCHVKIKVRS